MLSRVLRNAAYLTVAFFCSFVFVHLYGLQFDTSGRYLLAVSGGGNQISVYSVDYSTGDVTAVPGSPFAVTRGSSVTNSSDFTRTFSIDPSNKFLYALN